ncbi:bestrophin family protein [Neorhizobium sp. JUb45]|uniref:bestrophin family protein n=1 Tax=unclassified Neorhizobium TaxID=2629175 RepID=UPI0010475D4E|nr:bestrophin family protein [Neorhizobium sp. JUb45]TCR06718.1 putative membrane protein [Neorhizobium sp. JUb45]
MIVRPRPSLFKLFFIVKGSIIMRILPQMLFVFAVSTIVVAGHRDLPWLVPGSLGAPFALFGIAISVFLGFRNNACYDRWWEARKCWGQLIYAARGLARQSVMLAELHGERGETARRSLIDLTIALPHVLVGYLRPDGQQTVTPVLPEDIRTAIIASKMPAEVVLNQISRQLAILRRDDMLTDMQLKMLDENVQQMGIAVANCERIRFTPLPFGYTLLLHRTAHLFCFLLPFGFSDLLGWGMPFVTVLIAYTFFGLDALGDELEEPFGLGPNDLPITTLAAVIEHNLREALGETDLPPLPQPVDYVLT